MNAERRRLLIVLPASVVGGAERRSVTLALGLRDLGVDVTVLTQEGIAELFEKESIRVYRFDDFGLNEPYDYGFANAWGYAKALSHVVARANSDAVLAMMHPASIFLAIASAMHPKLFANVRRVGSILGPVSAYFQNLGRKPSTAERLAARLMFLRLHRVVVPSQGVLDDLVQVFPRAKQRSQVIYNGVDLQRVRTLARVGVPEPKADPWIVMPARFGKEKDHPTLLYAFREIMDKTSARLILIGDGEERSAIERLATDLGLESRLTFTGFLDNPFPWISAADVVVLSSHFEGFGLILVEAMALGKPVISTDCPSGPREIIRDGIDGILVSPQNRQELGRKMLELLNSPELRGRLSASAIGRAEQFSKERMLSEYYDLLIARRLGA